MAYRNTTITPVSIVETMTDQPTPWMRVLEKLITTQQLKKFPTFYGTQRFITMFIRACNWSPT
jgi:hypothetical protein